MRVIFACAVLLPGLAVGWTTAGAAPPPDVSIEHLFDLVRPRFSGDRAHEIVAFMEPHWRLPGNSGFDASIHRVAKELDRAGYVTREEAGPDDRLVYWIERRPMRRPAWEPIDGALRVVGGNTGEDDPLLEFATNRNMIAINSASTPEGGVTASLIDVGEGDQLGDLDVSGKIVMGVGSLRRLYRGAVLRGGALGVLYFGLPDYNHAETHQDSITFRSVPADPGGGAWAVLLSYRAHRRLQAAIAGGEVTVRVDLSTRRVDADELTLLAELRGAKTPEQRFVFSAHVQEPGANDNASGVAVQAEIACVAAALLREREIDPARTLTFLWGDEISAIARYLREAPERTAGVRWGVSLDMVGEDTTKTGGTFLIEKMPDPSAIWTRGDDRHTEWGARPVREDELVPHYFNDFILRRCLEQAAFAGWRVETNPFEGGSDHVPFLHVGKPGLLLWHFTDVYYHTDRDRLEMVSPVTMRNVGTSALVAALCLLSGDESLARRVIDETLEAAGDRLRSEALLSRVAIEHGGDSAEERRILTAWRDWYDDAIASAADIEIGAASPAIAAKIAAAREEVHEIAGRLIASLPPSRVEPVHPGVP